MPGSSPVPVAFGYVGSLLEENTDWLFYSSIHFPPPLVNGCRKVWCSKNGVCKINQYKKIHFLDRPTSGAGTVSLGVGSVHHCGPDWNGSISTGWTGNEIYILYNMMLI